jgi:hypothetical protein
MKILFLVSRDSLHTASAGGDIQANEWAKYLAGKGHSVTYICGTFKGSKKKEIIDGVEVIRVGPGNLLFFYTFFYYMLNCRGKYDVVYEEVISGAQLPLLAPLYVREPAEFTYYTLSVSKTLETSTKSCRKISCICSP